MALFEKLPKEICVEGITFVLDDASHKGIGNLRDIKWYEYKIVNADALNVKYDNVTVCTFAITRDIRKLAEKNIIERNVSAEETPRPHIDYKTGNIHPCKKYVQDNDGEIVRQLVLCRGLGPKTPEIEEVDAYVYKNKPRQRVCRIHKACYFPLIEADDSLKENWRYKLLSEIWKRIPDELKNEK